MTIVVIGLREAPLLKACLESLAENGTLSVDEIAKLLITDIRRLKASRVVIDSLSGFELALAPTFRQDFFAQMRELFCRQLYFIGYLRPNLSG